MNICVCGGLLPPPNPHGVSKCAQCQGTTDRSGRYVPDPRAIAPEIPARVYASEEPIGPPTDEEVAELARLYLESASRLQPRYIPEDERVELPAFGELPQANRLFLVRSLKQALEEWINS